MTRGTANTYKSNDIKTSGANTVVMEFRERRFMDTFKKYSSKAFNFFFMAGIILSMMGGVMLFLFSVAVAVSAFTYGFPITEIRITFHE